jgi:hypothetical protein
MLSSDYYFFLSAGCMYEGRYYSVGATITDHGTYGIACGELGIHAWDINVGILT